MSSTGFLRVEGTRIVRDRADGKVEEVILRGAGLGGWMKCVLILLSFRVISDNIALSSLQHGELYQRSVDITSRLRRPVHCDWHSGYPGCEFQIRETLADTIGKEKSELFFDKVRSGCT